MDDCKEELRNMSETGRTERQESEICGHVCTSKELLLKSKESVKTKHVGPERTHFEKLPPEHAFPSSTVWSAPRPHSGLHREFPNNQLVGNLLDPTVGDVKFFLRLF